MELKDLGYLAHEVDKGQVRTVAVKKQQDNAEAHLSAALNALLFGIKSRQHRGVFDLEPRVKIRGQAFHVGNERSSKAEAGRLKWLGVKPGVADWIFTGPPLVAIELKVGKNKPTKKQAEWGRVLEGWGGHYYVCRSLGDVLGMLWAHGLVLEPDTEEALARALVKVRHYWLIKYGREIP